MMRPCAEFNCGQLADGTYCEQHTYKKPPPTTVYDKTTARGYDHQWRRLSERARKLQPFCSDCGSRDNLTADHSPEAWQRKAEGKTIRLRDVDVCCLDCNIKRGAARGETPTWGGNPNQNQSDCTAGVQVCVSLPGGAR